MVQILLGPGVLREVLLAHGVRQATLSGGKAVLRRPLVDQLCHQREHAGLT